MKKRKLEFGIDEFTLVAQADTSKLDSVKKWPSMASGIMFDMAKTANMQKLFGDVHKVGNPPAGYTVGITFGNNPFYFAIAHHPLFVKMGVVLKFSAHAWSEYQTRWQTRYHEIMNIAKFLKLFGEADYEIRLSRIDFTADFFNYPLTVNMLYTQISMSDPKIVVYDSLHRLNISKLSAVVADGVVNTFYLGSKKANTDILLRVYNKKLQQTQPPGVRYQRAIAEDAWVRMEVVFKGTYAHQLTDILLNEVKTEQDLLNLIANKINEKYVFWSTITDKPILFSKDLQDKTNKAFNRLVNNSPRDNDLARSVSYIRHGSGFYPILFKIQQIWGKSALYRFVKLLLQDYKSYYKPNPDVEIWLRKHKSAIQNTSLDDLFLRNINKNLDNENDQNSSRKQNTGHNDS